ncbi:KIF15 [Symbiodinium pilosum]|uniref:KIF15 protein n=1 Tax=Symbiodinium pilosum TaxID=2952 RepID=A0A812VSZ3_SYMPI|nr:KIF15 [Symbiodinium pilosum]
MASASHDPGPDEEEQEEQEFVCGQSSGSRSRHRVQTAKKGQRGHYPRPRALLPPSQRARPTHFVAIHLKSREIQRCVEQLQQWFVAQDKLFERCLVPIKRLHTALLLTSFEEPRLSEARQVVSQAARTIREFLGGESVQLRAEGIGSFGGRVVFARVRTEPPELLQAMHHLLCRVFMRHNFPILDDTGQAWLAPGEEPRQFSGHASFLKVTKGMAHSRTEEEKNSFKALHVSDEDIAKWNGTCLGTQLCGDFELLSILGTAHDGYYPRIKVEKLPGAEDVMQSASSMCQAGDLPSRGVADAVEEAWRSKPPSPEKSEPEAAVINAASGQETGDALRDSKRRLSRLGPDVWQVVSQVITICDLLCLATAAKETLTIVQSVVCKAKVTLFSETAHASSCLDGSCLDWDRNRIEGTQCPALQIRSREDFLSQPAGEQLFADIGFVEDSQQLIFGRSLEGLHTALREALPLAFGDLHMEVEAVRNISSPTKTVLDTLCAAQPEIVGIEGLAVHDLPAWVHCVQQLTRAWGAETNLDLMEQQVGGGHNSIHDDTTAAQVGLKLAPIHGTVHWSQLTPLLLKAFGPAWFETGSISVHFVNMVGHRQPVRAFIAEPDPSKSAQQLEVWMEHLDGRLVFEGTASVGLRPGEMTTMAQSKIASIKPVKGRLLFTRYDVGTQSLQPEPAKIEFEKVIGPLFPYTHRRKLELITEFHPWFSEEAGHTSPWGKAILPPESFNQIMLGSVGGARPPRFPPVAGDEWLHKALGGRTPVGLFGGCEVIMVNGPIFVGVDYECTREIVGSGETPRAEFRWTTTYLREKGSQKLVAQMTLQEMQLKASLDGYAQLRAQSDGLVQVDNAAYFSKLLEALPPLVRGLDFQNLACTFLDFPVACLPKACTAFGTIVLQKDVRGCSARGSMDFGDFISTFPRFPQHVRLVRASLGTEGHWAFSAKEIADVFRAKFPGLVVLQLELSLRHSAATSDVPFIELARALIDAEVRVEVTSIRCRPHQYEFLRAALTHAGAAVQQLEDECEQIAYPFSHPRFDWSKAGLSAHSFAHANDADARSAALLKLKRLRHNYPAGKQHATTCTKLECLVAVASCSRARAWSFRRKVSSKSLELHLWLGACF